MPNRVLGCLLAALCSSCILAAAAHGSSMLLGAVPSAVEVEGGDSWQYLVLMFKVNVSAACQDQCRLALTSMSCLEAVAVAAANTAASQLEGFHTVSLRREAVGASSLELAVECDVAAKCQAAPAKRAMWQGAGCGVLNERARSALPYTMVSSTSGNHTVALLNYGAAVLEVMPSPRSLPNSEKQAQQEEQQEARMVTEEDQSEELDSSAAPPAADTDFYPGYWIARLLMIVWLVACALLPELLPHLVAR